MITASNLKKISCNGISSRMEFIEGILRAAAAESKTDVFINHENITPLVREELTRLGYEVGPINNNKVSISW